MTRRRIDPLKASPHAAAHAAAHAAPHAAPHSAPHAGRHSEPHPRPIDALSLGALPAGVTDGTQTAAVYRTLVDIVEAQGRGITLAEWRAAYEARTAAPATSGFPGIVSGLRARGVVVLVGGVHGRSRYAPAGSPAAAVDVVEGDPTDPDAVALAALRAACEVHGRAVTTREADAVYAARLAAGEPGLPGAHRNALRWRLEQLARTPARGPRAGHPPRVARHEGVDLAGRVFVVWQPAGLVVSASEGGHVPAAMVRPAMLAAPPRTGGPAARPVPAPRRGVAGALQGDVRPGNARPENARPENARPENARPENARPENARQGEAAPGAACEDGSTGRCAGAPMLAGRHVVGAVSRAVLVRQAVAVVTALCRRPVSRWELTWWIEHELSRTACSVGAPSVEAQADTPRPDGSTPATGGSVNRPAARGSLMERPEGSGRERMLHAAAGTTREPHPAAIALPLTRIDHAIQVTARSDAKSPTGSGAGRARIRVVTTPQTGWGAYPARYRLGEPTPLDRACCRVEDAALFLRVEDESRSIGALMRRASAAGSDAFHHLAWVRRELLRARLVEAFAGQDPAEVARRLRHAAEWRRHVVEDRSYPDRMARQYRVQLLRERERHLVAALEIVLDDPAVRAAVASVPPIDADARWRRPVSAWRPLASVAATRTVGEGATIAFGDLQPFLQTATALRYPERSPELQARAARQWLKDVRRIPVPGARPKRQRVGQGRYEHLSALDRVDAMSAVLRQFRGTYTRVFLRNAVALLGEVARDVELARGWLGAPDVRDAFDGVSRRALVVYLGLLGWVPRPDGVLHDVDDPDDAAAWALAVIVGTTAGDRDAILERLADGEGLTRGGARQLLATAQARVSSGHLFTAVG